MEDDVGRHGGLLGQAQAQGAQALKELDVRLGEIGSARAGAADLTEADVELFERLRALRLRLAQEAAVPPYVIFHDATLAAMAAARPVTEEELLVLPGIGEKKLVTYGKAFLEEIMAAPSESAEAE